MRAAGLMCWAALQLVWAGCAAPGQSVAPVPAWELAGAEPFVPIPVGQARISFDRPLPGHLVQELSPEYALVVIRSAQDWADVQRRLHLPAAPPAVDLTQGCIVGLVAHVGENLDGRWPIHLRYLRRRGNQGSLEASFTPGLYYPLLTAGYVDLVYAPGIRNIGLVSIDHRQFIIRHPVPAH
jgi:hypothetical protein